MTMSLARVAEPLEGELDGPAWDGVGLLFCVLAKNEIRRYDPASGRTAVVRQQTVRTRGLAFAPDGRLYGAQGRARRIVWYRDDGAAYYLASTIDGLRRNDPQHLVVDRGGRIWSTDRWTEESSGGPVGYPPLGHCSVLRLDPVAGTDPLNVGDWALRRMTTDTVAPYGLALSPDERTLYVSDRGGAPAGPSLRAYAVGDDVPLRAGTVLRSFESGDEPAGICVDAGGRIVVAIGGVRPRIELVGVDGRVSGEIAVPGAPTACAIGGADLYVTTATGDLLRSIHGGRE